MKNGRYSVITQHGEAKTLFALVYSNAAGDEHEIQATFADRRSAEHWRDSLNTTAEAFDARQGL